MSRLALLRVLAAAFGLCILSPFLNLQVPATFAAFQDAEAATTRLVGHVPTASCALFWANASVNDALKLTGTRMDYQGCLHSNGELEVGGGSSIFQRTLRHAGGFSTNENNHSFLGGIVGVPSEDFAYRYVFSRYAPGGCVAELALSRGEYWTASGNVQLKGALLRTGLHYVQGSATVDLSGWSGRITVVATGGLKVVSDAAGAVAYVDGLLAYSAAPGPNSITFNSNGGTVAGNFYALGGDVKFSGNGITYTGQVVGDTIQASGADSTFLPPPPPYRTRC